MGQDRTLHMIWWYLTLAASLSKEILSVIRPETRRIWYKSLEHTTLSQLAENLSEFRQPRLGLQINLKFFNNRNNFKIQLQDFIYLLYYLST